MDGKESGEQGCQPRVLGDVFQSGGKLSVYIWVRDVGADPPHGTGPGKISKWGCKEDNMETTKETRVGGLGITNTGFSNGGGVI